MKKILLQFLGIIFISNLAFSQSQVIFSKSKEDVFLIKSSTGQNNIKNAILKKIAKGNNVPVGNLRVSFSYTETLQILKRRDKLELSVNLKNFNLTGDINYKEFPLKNKLIPSKLSFVLQWMKGKKILKTFNFNDVKISGNDIEIVNMTVPDTIKNNKKNKNYKIKIINKKFDYTRNNKRRFDKRVSLIDKYYSENKKIRNKLRKINEINSDEAVLSQFDNIKQLYTFHDLAKKSLDYANMIEKEKFYKKLELNKTDPKTLKKKLNNLKNKSKTLLSACDHVINNLDAVYFDRGMDMLIKQNTSRAKINFNKSIEINPQFAPSHLQLAKLFYHQGYVNEAINKLFDITKMTPDRETRIQTIELANGIYKDFLLDANNLNNRKLYDDALIVLESALRLCNDFPEVQCLNNMNNEFSRAVFGKYDLILYDIDIAISKNDLFNAEKLIDIATKYQIKNSDFIVNDDDITIRIENIYKRYIEIGNSYVRQKYFEKAIIEFNEANRICNNYIKIRCTQALENGYLNAHTGIYKKMIVDAQTSLNRNNLNIADDLIISAISYREQHYLRQAVNESKLLFDIKSAIYNDCIKKGESFMSSKNFRQALVNFDKALDIEQKYNTVPYNQLHNYIKKSAEGWTLQIVEDGKSKVKVNNLTSARRCYSNAKNVVLTYNIENNQTTRKAIIELKDMIFKQECINAQNAYDNYYRKAIEQINENKYIEADNTLSKAINYADKNSQCDIDTQNVNSKKNEIAQAVNFTKQMNNVLEDIKRKNYNSSIDKYISAGEFYYSRNISRFGLEYKELFDFILLKNSNFINFAVGYYFNKKEYEKAVQLLKTLSNREYRRRSSKNNQTILGTELATKDFNQAPNSNYKTNITKYTGGDRFFKFFAKAYKKQWKKLK